MTSPLVAHHIAIEARGPKVRLACAVRDPRASLPAELWLELPARHAELIRPEADAFLPTLMLAAMRRGCPLLLESSVSEDRLDGAHRVMEIYQRYSAGRRDGLASVALAAAQRRRADPRGRFVASFFSAGVDSFYTLIRNHARYEPGDSRRITHLVVLLGFDLPLDATALYEELLRSAHDVGERLGVEIIPVTTNLRSAVRGLDWDRYGFGAVLAGIAVALSPGTHTVYVPSGGRPFLETVTKHTSMQPEVAAWWSSDVQELVFDPIHLTRPEKVAFLARHPWALGHLRVCWESRGGAYNCGQCEKCQRTMVELTLAGALASSGRFPPALDLDRLRAAPTSRLARSYWRELAAHAAARREHGDLAAAIRAKIGHAEWADSLLGRLDATASSLARRAGLDGARVKAFDAWALRGAAGVVYRTLRDLVARRS